MSKGSTQRPTNPEKFAEGYDRVFSDPFKIYHYRGKQVSSVKTKEEAALWIAEQINPTEYYWER